MLYHYLRKPKFAPHVSYSPQQVAAIYGLPKNYTGKGTTIAIIELGGAFSQTDFNTFRQQLGLPPLTVTCKGTQASDPGGANVEVMLDAEIITGIAPDANITMYFMPNTDTGFVQGIQQAVADGVDAISISWGGPEGSWPAASRQAMDAALQAASAAGNSVYVAAGDNGSSDGGSGQNVDYPSSSPYAVGCGGTSLPAGGPEVVWNDGTQGGATGGGFSNVYLRPSWQVQSNAARGVPDVSGLADPQTGWNIIADGQQQVVGGTSAVAPLWAGIHACLCEAHGGKIGFLNPTAYQHPGAFKDITSGNNGSFSAGPGWDACTGLGSPAGAPLFELFAVSQPPAPTPTPTPSPPPTPIPAPPPPLVLADMSLSHALSAGNYSLLHGFFHFAGNMGLSAKLPAGNYAIVALPAANGATGQVTLATILKLIEELVALLGKLPVGAPTPPAPALTLTGILQAIQTLLTLLQGLQGVLGKAA